MSVAHGTWPVLPEEISVEIGGEVYGARPVKPGPPGGGPGYFNVISSGDFPVSTADELIAALAGAKGGQVVFLERGAEVDMTGLVYAEESVIEIPGGVTLAGDRGVDDSPGALVFSDAFHTRPMIRAMGPGVRVTGLRLRGPNTLRRVDHWSRAFGTQELRAARGHDYYYRLPVSDGVSTEHDRLEVDNCEVLGWSHAGIALRRGEGHHVHHNYIHHNQYGGLGYGVSHDTAFSLIEANLFDYNRHSIAGTGRPGSGYEARDNVELGESLGHCFDMHGGADRKDGTDVAGDWIRIYHNTFLFGGRLPRINTQEVKVRGLAREELEVYANWFFSDSPEEAVGHLGGATVRDNACGTDDPKVL